MKKNILSVLTLCLLCACAPSNPSKAVGTEPTSMEAVSLVQEEETRDNVIKILCPATMTEGFKAAEEECEILYPELDIQVSENTSENLNAGDFDILISQDEYQFTALKEKGLLTDENIKPILSNPIVLVKPIDSPNETEGFELVHKTCTHFAMPDSQTALGQATRKIFESIGNIGPVSNISINGGSTAQTEINCMNDNPNTVGVLFGSDAKANEDKVKAIIVAEPYIHREPITVKLSVLSTASEGTEDISGYIQSTECIKAFKECGYEAYKPSKEA
ncbi:MAG: substrate-binding domain-containing protein [Firmicutes bacterium]|nr:substrate-binding domain-containing protein [Bacillota bacterium]